MGQILDTFARLVGLGTALRHDRSGTASIEFGLIVGTLIVIMLNGIEVARYYYARMELENAVHMAAQAVWDECETTAQIPTSTNCSGRNTRMTNAFQSSSLGSGVTQSSGFPTEQWYCVNTGTGALSAAGATKPADCSGFNGQATEQAGYYITVRGQYTYSPLFTSISIGSAMPTTVTSTTMVRLQ